MQEMQKEWATDHFRVCVTTRISLSLQEVRVPCRDRIWPKAGISCRDRALHVATVPARATTTFLACTRHGPARATRQP